MPKHKFEDDPAARLEAEGVPGLEDAAKGKEMTGDAQEGMIPPRDHPQGAEQYGITIAEARAGEPLDLKLRREVDDHAAVEEAGLDDLTGRIVEPESEVDELDLTAEPLGFDVGRDDGAFSAEEAAMHITENP